MEVLVPTLFLTKDVIFFFFLPFLEPLPQLMEVPRLGV